MGTDISSKRSVVTLPLKVEPWQSDVMEKRFEMIRSIYNAMLGYELKQYNKMLRDPEYIAAKEFINDVYKNNDDDELSRLKKTNEFKKASAVTKEKLLEYGITKYAFGSAAIDFSKHFSQNIAAHVAQITIGESMYAAFNKLLFGNGKKVRFKKKDSINTIESDCKSGIRIIDSAGHTVKHRQPYQDIFVCFSANKGKKLVMPIVIPKNDLYKVEMLDRDFKRVMIEKKKVKDKIKYFVHIIVVGPPAIRYKDGTPVNMINEGKIGVYIDTTSITIAKDDGTIKEFDLNDGIISYQDEIAEYQRHMAASRMAMNPDNFNEDGTIKNGVMEDGKRHKLIWSYSNAYKHSRSEVANLRRKEKETRKNERYCVANKILEYGSDITINDYPFQVAAMRKKLAEGEDKDEKGRPIKKKKAGDAIGKLAPAEVVRILDQKLDAANLNKVNKVKLKNINKEMEDYRKFYAKELLNM